MSEICKEVRQFSESTPFVWKMARSNEALAPNIASPLLRLSLSYLYPLLRDTIT